MPIGNQQAGLGERRTSPQYDDKLCWETLVTSGRGISYLCNVKSVKVTNMIPIPLDGSMNFSESLRLERWNPLNAWVYRKEIMFPLLFLFNIDLIC